MQRWLVSVYSGDPLTVCMGRTGDAEKRLRIGVPSMCGCPYGTHPGQMGTLVQIYKKKDAMIGIGKFLS